MGRKKKLDEAQRANLRERLAAKESPTKLAEEFGLSRNTIYRISKESLAKPAGGQQLFGEFGVSGLSRFGGTVHEDYLRVWRSLSEMVPLVKEMLDHPIIGAIIFATEMSIRGAEWATVPASESAVDQEAAEFLESCMHDMSHTWDDHITQAFSMIPYGFAPFEKVFKKRNGLDVEPFSKYDDGKIGWRKFAFRSQDTLAPGNEWVFDPNGGVQGMNQQAPPDWRPVSIPIEKLILYRTTAAKNNPQGRSALRSSYIPYFYSKNLQEIEGISAERMGAGLPVIYLGDGTKPGKTGAGGDFDFAKNVVRDVRMDEQGGVVFPYPKQTTDGRGITFELMSPPSKGVVDFDKAIMRYNRQIAQTMLAQFIFLGMTEQGTQALAVRLTDFYAEAVKGWLKSIASVLNKFAVPQLFKLNAWTGLTGLPEFEIGSVGQADIGVIMEAVLNAVSAGVVEPDEGIERKVRQILEFPQRGTPEGGELLRDINPPVPVPVPGPEPADEIDEEADEELKYMLHRTERLIERALDEAV